MQPPNTPGLTLTHSAVPGSSGALRRRGGWGRPGRLGCSPGRAPGAARCPSAPPRPTRLPARQAMRRRHRAAGRRRARGPRRRRPDRRVRPGRAPAADRPARVQRAPPDASADEGRAARGLRRAVGPVGDRPGCASSSGIRSGTSTCGRDEVVIDGRYAARAVVAADGANGTLRRRLGVPPTPPTAVAIALRAYATADETDQCIVMAEHGWPAYAWLFPIGDGRANVGFGMSIDAGVSRVTLEDGSEKAAAAGRRAGRRAGTSPSAVDRAAATTGRPGGARR